MTSSNTVTPAGTTYSNLVSSIGYSQAMPDNGTRGIAEFLFATNTWDTSGYYNNGMAIGAPAFTTGPQQPRRRPSLSMARTVTSSFPPTSPKAARSRSRRGFIGTAAMPGSAFLISATLAPVKAAPSQYMFLTPDSGSGTLRFAINNGSGEQIVERSGALASGSWQHVAVTLNGSSAILYVNGASVATNNSVTITPSAFSPIKNYLGKSQFPTTRCSTENSMKWKSPIIAMTPAQISVLYNGTQNPNYISGVWTNNASGYWGASNNWSGGAVGNGVSRIADFSTIDVTVNPNVTLDSARTIGGLRFGDLAGSQVWALVGANTLTLDGGGGITPAIAVNQNIATISTPLSGSYGFTKTGNGTLTLNGTENVGGGLTVSVGTVNISGGTTTFGSGTSSVGYLNGSGNLTMTGGALAMAGELRVGGSDQNGSQYAATGEVTVANATLSVGALTVARGNYLDNSISGTVTLNSGGTLISTNDAILEFAGMGRGKLALNGGNFIVGPTATKWLMIGYYDSGAGELDITNGNLFLENSTSLKMCRSGNTGGNVVNQIGGNVTFYNDAGVTIGGGGNLDLNYAGGATSTNIYNLNGGTLTVPQVGATSGTGNSTFNFNGGTLKSAASSATFMQGLTRVNIRNYGAKIDTAGFNVTIGQALLHSAISGDSATDGGLAKNGAGTLTLSGTNTYTGTTIINSGTLALSSSGSVANSRNISVAVGALFDVSAVTDSFAMGAGQTLSGSGSVNGAVAINGTISPGNSGATGTLTLSNAPALNGVTLIEINRNNGAPLNDQIVLPSSGITYGGTLTVNNIGALLTAGDSFQIFSAASYSGVFARLNLPALGAGLAWNTNGLTNGMLPVIATVGPQFSGLNQTSDGNFHFAGAGAAGVTYELDAATNLAPPIPWMFVTNAVAGLNGLFDLWDLSATNFSQRYYRIISNQ